MVRTAAAQGLTVEHTAASCLRHGLSDRAAKVRAASVTTLADIDARNHVPQFRNFVLDAKEDRRVRRAALMALGRLGHIKTAADLIATHIKHGELSTLAHVAVLSLERSKAPDALFVTSLKSSASTVILAAARILHRRDPDKYRSLILESRDRMRGRLKEQLDLLMSPQVNPQSLGQDIVTDAPEDAD